jgi:hypothetical protein
MLVRSVAVALLAGLFTLPFALTGAAPSCAMWDHGTSGRPTAEAAPSGAVAASMHHDMWGMTMVAMHGTTETDEGPCDHPVSPEQCRTMAPCTAGFLPGRAAAEPAPAQPSESILANLVAMPPSVSFPPALRPPRA